MELIIKGQTIFFHCLQRIWCLQAAIDRPLGD
jgi:hypothetical protein